MRHDLRAALAGNTSRQTRHQSNFTLKLLWRREREAPPPAREVQAKFIFAVNAGRSVSKSKCSKEKYDAYLE
jgi:hypothetical protein